MTARRHLYMALAWTRPDDTTLVDPLFAAGKRVL